MGRCKAPVDVVVFFYYLFFKNSRSTTISNFPSNPFTESQMYVTKKTCENLRYKLLFQPNPEIAVCLTFLLIKEVVLLYDPSILPFPTHYIGIHIFNIYVKCPSDDGQNKYFVTEQSRKLMLRDLLSYF